MDYLLTCDCGKEITVTRSQAGQELVCECGKTLKVPTLRNFSELKPVAAPAASTGKKPSGGSVWSGWRGPLIAVCAAVFLIAGLATGRFLLQRASVDMNYTYEDELRQVHDKFEETGPDGLNIIWHSFQTQGLGQRARPMFYFAQKYAAERLWMAQISGSITAAAAVIGFMTWLSAAARSRKLKAQAA